VYPKNRSHEVVFQDLTVIPIKAEMRLSSEEDLELNLNTITATTSWSVLLMSWAILLIPKWMRPILNQPCSICGYKIMTDFTFWMEKLLVTVTMVSISSLN
jgi:hypothetical protein